MPILANDPPCHAETGRPAPHVLRGSRPGGQGYLLARRFADRPAPLFVVTPESSRRDELINDLRCFLDDPPSSPSGCAASGVVLGYVPEPQGTQSPAPSVDLPLWRLRSSEPVVVIAAAASLRYGMAPGLFAERLLPVQVGDARPLPGFAAALVERGYRRTSTVETAGEFALRGGILDVFSPGERQPWRLEFFGDEVETIRTFDAASQLSVESLHRIVIPPLHGLPPQGCETAAGWERLRAHLRAHDWQEADIAAHFEHWRQQHPAAWPWGLDAFFFDDPESPLADLPDAVTLCCVDVEDVHLTLDQLPPPVAMRLGDRTVPSAVERCVDAATLTRQLRTNGPTSRCPATATRKAVTSNPQNRYPLSTIHYPLPSPNCACAVRRRFPAIWGALSPT